jgi:DNA processing protein
VIVVEAPLRSGSLITAAHAREQGRDVLVLPGNTDLAGFEGSNELLRDGAELITKGWDAVGRHAWRFPQGKLKQKRNLRQIINSPQGENSVRPQPKRNPEAAEAAKPVSLKVPAKARELVAAVPVLDGDEAIVYNAIEGSMTADSITSVSDLTPNRVMVALTMLELKGAVKNLGGMNYEKL